MANLNDFQEQLDILSATKTSIKEAIIGKGQEVSSEDSFSSYADKIDDIVTLEEGTADADAVASDIEIGKTAYVNGQKITGNIEKFKSIAGYASILDSDITGIGDATSALLFTTNAYSKSIIPGGNVHIYVYKSRIASQQELTADKLKVGETVLGITGTFTDDANATAQDIAYNKTAYVNGTKVTGSIETIGPNEEISGMLMDATTVQKTTIYDEHDNPYPGIQYTFLASGNTLTRDGADVSTNAKYSDIVSALSGTADRISADKILSGETILGVSGTATSDADATASDILYSKSAYVNGQKVTGKMRAYLTGSSTAITDMIYFSDDVSDRHLRVTIKLKENNDGYVSSDFRLTQFMLYSEIQNKIRYLTAGNIKDGVTILGVTGNVIELNGETKTITPTTSQQVITPSQNKNAITEVTVNAVTSAIDSNIQADNIKKGVTILGVSGKSSVVETDDATATNSDIASGKTAYVNGNKVVGVIVDRRNSGARIAGANVTDTNPYRVTITGTGSSTTEIINSSTSISCEIANNLLASGIGLTADKIKSGVKILGIIGTYTGSSMKEYASTTAMNNDIANISDGEVVKVDDGTTLDYYIKDTTMVKLIKESETISPQDFEEAEAQIEDLFGEGE